jgi:hypothetical protein
MKLKAYENIEVAFFGRTRIDHRVNFADACIN